VGEYLQIIGSMYGMAVGSSVPHPIKLEMWYGMESRSPQRLEDNNLISDKEAMGDTYNTLYIVRREKYKVLLCISTVCGSVPSFADLFMYDPNNTEWTRRSLAGTYVDRRDLPRNSTRLMAWNFKDYVQALISACANSGQFGNTPLESIQIYMQGTLVYLPSNEWSPAKFDENCVGEGAIFIVSGSARKRVMPWVEPRRSFSR